MRLLLPLLLLLALAAGAAGGGSPDADALLAAKAALSDPTGALASWTADSDDHCAWAGVTCGPGAAVVALDVSGLNLSGALPHALSRLRGLQRLSAAANALYGPIPPSLARLQLLLHLNLSNNAFNGSFPPALARLRALRVLDLYNNNLTSTTLPLEVTRMPALRHLHLGGNFFSGEIPPEYGRWLRLQYLAVSGNELSGRIPHELGNLTSLRIQEALHWPLQQLEAVRHHCATPCLRRPRPRSKPRPAGPAPTCHCQVRRRPEAGPGGSRRAFRVQRGREEADQVAHRGRVRGTTAVGSGSSPSSGRAAWARPPSRIGCTDILPSRPGLTAGPAPANDGGRSWAEVAAQLLCNLETRDGVDVQRWEDDAPVSERKALLKGRTFLLVLDGLDEQPTLTAVEEEKFAYGRRGPGIAATGHWAARAISPCFDLIQTRRAKWSGQLRIVGEMN